MVLIVYKLYSFQKITKIHGDVQDVSPSSAPLKAIMFLEQALENRISPVDDRKEITRRLLACLLIKPFETTDWWAKTLTLVEKITCEVPCSVLKLELYLELLITSAGRNLDLCKLL